MWYYGTYCLGPGDGVHYGKTRLNWPWIGPFLGFRTSTDYGHHWIPPPHTPSEPLFGESGMWGYPIKIGTPKCVGFGKDQDGKPVWTNDFSKIKPLLEWDNNMGCVTITWNPVFKKTISQSSPTKKYI